MTSEPTRGVACVLEDKCSYLSNTSIQDLAANRLVTHRGVAASILAMWSRFKNWWESRSVFSDTARAGAEGERLAADFLRKQNGYKIVARNWRSPQDRRDEIDLVCRDQEVLVFVEVKTRSADALVSGFHAVNQAKKRILLRACTAYIRALGSAAPPHTFRFDIVEVSHNGDGVAPEVRHFENVPLFPKDRRP